MVIRSLICAGALAVAACSMGQSLAGYVSKGQAYVVNVTPLKTVFSRGNVSVKTDMLVGLKATDPAGAFGFGGTLTYQVNKTYGVFVGLAEVQDTATWSTKNLSLQRARLFVGISGPIKLGIFGL